MPDTNVQTNQPQSTARSVSDPERQELARPYRTELARPEGSGSPFSFMRRFMNEIDQLFDDIRLGSSSPTRGHGSYAGVSPRWIWSPQMDVFERNGELVVHADLAGVQQDEIRVNVNDGMLTISGERAHAHEHEKDGVYQCERTFGAFRRSVALPEGVSSESVRASFDNGVLEVTMPLPKKQVEAKGRSVPIGPKPSGGVKH